MTPSVKSVPDVTTYTTLSVFILTVKHSNLFSSYSQRTGGRKTLHETRNTVKVIEVVRRNYKAK